MAEIALKARARRRRPRPPKEKVLWIMALAGTLMTGAGDLVRAVHGHTYEAVFAVFWILAFYFYRAMGPAGFRESWRQHWAIFVFCLGLLTIATP